MYKEIMSDWVRGEDSTVYRFEKKENEAVSLTLELEAYDNGEVEVRAIKSPDKLLAATETAESIEEAMTYAKEQWGLDDQALPDYPSVRVRRLVLSLLADYVGSDVVFGIDVPAETRDALAAAYETLDEPGLPLTFHDCPRDGAALEPRNDASGDSSQNKKLECPECGEKYLLDTDTGELEVDKP